MEVRDKMTQEEFDLLFLEDKDKWFKEFIHLNGVFWSNLAYTMLRSQLGYTATEVHSEGGYEGGGEYMCKVYKIEGPAGTAYVRHEGFYNSWDASEWDDCVEEVFPTEITRTEYLAAHETP
jgi:hypothetical protein